MPPVPPRRVLLVTRNLPPLVGGMERLNWHMAQELAKAAEVQVVGPRGSAALAPEGVQVHEVPLRPLWKFLYAARRVARRVAADFKPEVVLAGSGLTAPIARSAARCCGAMSAAYIHGLDVAVRHPVYQALWLPPIRRMDRIIVNSHATARLCRDVGVEADRIGVVHPGVEMPRVRSSDADAPLPSRLAAALAGCAGPVLLSVGRLSSRKGLREFVARSLPRIVTACPDAILFVIGEAPKNALYAQAQTPERIQAEADGAGVGKHVRFLGAVSDEELDALYTVATVHVFPVRDISGDPEGFGMVAVEAAAHGLPTAAFAVGGVVDAVSEGESGYLVQPSDYVAFADAVVRVVKDARFSRSSCIAFAEQFAWPEFRERIVANLEGSASPGTR